MDEAYTPQHHTSKRRYTWAVLFALLAALLVGALTSERSGWPSFIGDEATYLMQAESLAFDLDLDYSAADYHRFEDHWGRHPQGLILQSGDGGQLITFGKPFFYGVYLAPFVRLSPQRGPFVANALLLAFTCLFVARRLEPRLGPAAPLWVATLVFCSVTFAFTFWAHADLFLMCLTALALALVFEPGPANALGAHGRRRDLIRWALAGCLLAAVGFSRPLYLPLFLPALLALAKPRRRGIAVLLGSAAILMGLTASVHHQLTGSWTGYGALRTGFYEHTGYPDVNFPANQWTTNVRDELGNAAARTPLQTLQERPISPRLLAWNSWYFLFGRHVGLFPYFLPVFLVIFVRPRGVPALAVVVAVAMAVGLFLWTRPFNFYGGGGTLANRYFLPLYPALWFLPRQRLRILPVAMIGFAAAAFMANLWLAPRSFPITKEGTYQYVTPVAEQFLPFETSQSHLRLAGRDDLYDGFYLRFLNPEVRRRNDGLLRLPMGVRGEFLLGSTKEVLNLELIVHRPAEVAVEVEGALLGERLRDAVPGAIGWQLELAPPQARHPMWWSWQTVDLFPLEVRFLGAANDAANEQVLFELKPRDENPSTSPEP